MASGACDVEIISLRLTALDKLKKVRSLGQEKRSERLTMQIDCSQMIYTTLTHNLQQPVQETNPLIYNISGPGSQPAISQTCEK